MRSSESSTPPAQLAAGIEAFLAAVPAQPDEKLDVAEQRLFMRRASDALHLRFGEPGPAMASVEQAAVPVGPRRVRVRVFVPRVRTGSDAHLVLHGGGWWHGSPDELIVETACRERAEALQAPVLAVDYGLAPEHPFPQGIEDLYGVWTWLAAGGGADWGIDVRRASLGGASAGANLAAALSLKIRDTGAPLPLCQVLEVPALDLTGRHSLETGIPDRFGLGNDVLRDVFEGYLTSPQDAEHPYASPLLARDLSGLPPTHVMTAEWDPVRHEAELFAKRLAEAGVPATCSTRAGAVHGAVGLTKVWDGARRWRDEVLAFLRAAHGREERP